jgi:hypothetical protein
MAHPVDAGQCRDEMPVQATRCPPADVLAADTTEETGGLEQLETSHLPLRSRPVPLDASESSGGHRCATQMALIAVAGRLCRQRSSMSTAYSRPFPT